MASMWRKAMVYLGLGPDEEYDDYDVVDEPHAPPRIQPARPQPHRAPQPHHAPQPQPRPARPQARPERVGPLGPVDRASPGGSVRTLPTGRDEPVDPRPERPSAVRPIPAPAAKPHVVSPTSFNDVQEVADTFKASQPVIINLQGANRDLSRRLIDFSSGLCYGLGGQMERVADQVYLLTPTNVEVSAEERRRLQERGLVDR